MKRHDSDCSTNNRGTPELLGPCDCGASDTPRTDACEGYHAHDDGSCVPASFARELERELAAMKAAQKGAA